MALLQKMTCNLRHPMSLSLSLLTIVSCESVYEVATISRLPKIVSLLAEYRLFYMALLQKRPMILRVR